MQDFDLLLKAKKCEFFKKEIAFLGHIIMADGIQMDPEKIKAILEWPTSTDVKKVQFFHRMANYYWAFIKEFLKMVQLLMNLFRKEEEFQWTVLEQQAFDQIKEEFQKEEMRWHFDLKRQSFMNTDALNCMIGARLQQHDN